MIARVADVELAPRGASIRCAVAAYRDRARRERPWIFVATDFPGGIAELYTRGGS